MPFTLVHAGKYGTEDKLKTDATETKHNPAKTTQNTAKQNCPGLVAFYDTRPPGNEVGLFYNAPESTWGKE